jgi:hypothetical protein
MRWWLILLAAGCSTKANSKYCDSTCADPNTHCDIVKHECVAGAPNGGDMGMPDLRMIEDMAVNVDLTGADLTVVDLTPPPACTMSSTCPSPTPICDSTLLMCRMCTASDDATCLSLSAATPHCKLSGTNAGTCVACNVNADCAAATPTCNPDGSCRKCAANGDCDSKLCDLPSGACIAQSDIVYVNGANDSGQTSCSDTGKDGTQLKPFCQISTALTLVGVSNKHYVLVAGSSNQYDGFEITSTNGTLTIIGPGKDAATTARVRPAVANVDTILIDPSGSTPVSLAIFGLVVAGGGNGRALSCDDGGAGVPVLRVADCAFSTSTKAAVYINKCNATITESRMSGAAQGIYLGSNSQYFVQNCFFFNNSTGVDFETINGEFTFNSIGNNAATSGVTCNAAAVISNSIVFNNKMNGNSQFNGSTNCSLIAVVTGTDNAPSSGKIQLPPAFVGTNDLHLDVTAGANLTANQACCIDQILGTGPSPSPSPLPAIDIDGSKRPKGAHWDIGAHEAM